MTLETGKMAVWPEMPHLKGRGQCPSSSLWGSASWGGRTVTSSCSRISDIIIVNLVAGDVAALPKTNKAS